jgi:DNA repair protein RecN (Recombination protein N)
MITSIHIENYALIDCLDMDFHEGFSVITGETGAGKSIILGAIGLLLGQRADSKSIKPGAAKCVIEAEFDVRGRGLEAFFSSNDIDFDGSTCMVRRELTSAGKSRSFVNDTPAPLAVLKELGDSLIDIHSQHQNLLLNKENFQLGVLDVIGGNAARLASYGECYRDYKAVCAALEQAVEDARRNSEDEEFVRFQYEQLESAALTEGEQDQLEAESDMLTHAEDIKGGLYRAKNCLVSESDSDDALQMLKQCAAALHGVENLHIGSAELANRIDSCYIELKDIAEEIESHVDRIEYNPERLAYVDERLGLIYSLEKKHKVESLEELLVMKDELEARLNSITNIDENIEMLRKERDAVYARLLAEAEELSQARRKTAELVEVKMTEYLLPLGMPNVRFAVEMSSREVPDASGLDKVSFLFSANKNAPMQDVSSVASGGEIARVMLSLKALIAGAVQMPTIIFDEIDTGVSGAIAEKMAHIMQEMGANKRQVISITHLPQIAALGSHHYKVYKVDGEESTTSHIIELDDEQRIKEIANMLSGENITSAAISNAKELLGL